MRTTWAESRWILSPVKVLVVYDEVVGADTYIANDDGEILIDHDRDEGGPDGEDGNR